MQISEALKVVLGVEERGSDERVAVLQTVAEQAEDPAVARAAVDEQVASR
jgi:hypothetical protein